MKPPAFVLKVVALLVVTLNAATTSITIASPAIAWQQALGGSGADLLFAMQPTSDGGLVAGGRSSSDVSGNKTSSGFGGNDFWVVRLDGAGSKLWERAAGGSGDDGLFAITQTTDGSILAGGYSSSAVSGSKTSPAYGLRDIWVVKLDANGAQLWDKTFGGSGTETLFSMAATEDGGVVCVGYSSSGINGNKSTPGYGGSDYWIIQLDKDGNKVWERTEGGADEDFAYGVTVMTNGDILVAGGSASGVGGSKTAANQGAVGTTDLWLIKLTSSGARLWNRTYGSDGDDAYYSAAVTSSSDGGFVAGCDSGPGTGGNKTSQAFGLTDYWVVSVDGAGNKNWEQSHGGDLSDYLTSLSTTADGGFLVGGGSASGISGNKTSPAQGLSGSADFWVLRLDPAGSVQWEQTYGGSGSDAFYNLSVAALPDGGMLLGGDSNSGVSGNKTVAGLGGTDYWVLRLAGPRQPPLLRAVHQDLVSSGRFEFLLSGETNAVYRLEYSPDFQVWTPFSTNQVTSAEVRVTDPNVQGAQRRFYRAVELTAP